MRDKIQKIVVEAVAGTKDLTKAIDELLVLYDFSVSLPSDAKPEGNIPQEITDKLFNAITSNGCREIDEIRFNQAINEALMIYSKPNIKPLEWISVEDRLPEENETIWLWDNKNGFVYLGGLVLVGYDEGWLWAISNGIIYSENGKIVSELECDDEYNITHWMPLPETKSKP